MRILVLTKRPRMAVLTFAIVLAAAANLIKGTLGEADRFGGPWPEPSYWLVRSREDGSYSWCVSSYSGSEQGSRGGYTLFPNGRVLQFAAFVDGPDDNSGRLAAWEQIGSEGA